MSTEGYEELLFKQEDAEEIIRSFHNHPAFDVALSNLSSIKESPLDYDQTIWQLNSDIVEARPGGESKWFAKYENAKWSDPQSRTQVGDSAATEGKMFAATRIDPDDEWVRWAAASIANTTGKKPAVLPNLGGSLPNDIFTDVLGLRTIWVPHSYPGCSQHAPNEHLPPELLREALEVMTGLYWDLGSGETPAARR